MENSVKCYLWFNGKLEIALHERENLLNKNRKFGANVVIDASSCYCIMILKTENDVNFKETIILYFYGKY